MLAEAAQQDALAETFAVQLAERLSERVLTA